MGIFKILLICGVKKLTKEFELAIAFTVIMETLRKQLSRSKQKKKIEGLSESEVIADTDTMRSSTESLLHDSVEEVPTEKKKKKSSSSHYQHRILTQLENLSKVIQNQQNIQQDQLECLKKQQENFQPKISLNKTNEEKEEEPPEIVEVPPLLLESAEEKEQIYLEKYSRDVRRAFQVATSQLFLFLLLILGYFTVTVSRKIFFMDDKR